MSNFRYPLLMCVALASGGIAQTPPQSAKRQVTMADGERQTFFGTSYVAHGPTKAIAVLSSEFATVAVVEGALSVDQVSAVAGEALVTPIEGRKTERFAFDASRLSATLRPEWVATAGPALDALAKSQRGKRFWGMLEPTGVNANAPISRQAEAIQASYLNNDAIMDVRRRAGGDLAKLQRMTTERFIAAVISGDSKTAAALLDPKPFTDVSSDSDAWQAARLAFAQRNTTNPELAASLAGPLTTETSDGRFLVNNKFRISTVQRNRAVFISALEALQ
jgi:hypothetical protein